MVARERAVMLSHSMKTLLLTNKSNVLRVYYKMWREAIEVIVRTRNRQRAVQQQDRKTPSPGLGSNNTQLGNNHLGFGVRSDNNDETFQGRNEERRKSSLGLRAGHQDDVVNDDDDDDEVTSNNSLTAQPTASY